MIPGRIRYSLGLPIFNGSNPPSKTENTPTSGNKPVTKPDCAVFIPRVSVKNVGSHALNAVYWNNTPASAASNNIIDLLVSVSLIIRRGGEEDKLSV